MPSASLRYAHCRCRISRMAWSLPATIDLFQRAWHLSVPSELTESIEIYRATTMIRRHRSTRNFVSRFFVFPILDADPDRFVPFAERERRIFASIRGATSAQFYYAVFF